MIWEFYELDLKEVKIKISIVLPLQLDALYSFMLCATIQRPIQKMSGNCK